MLGELEERNTMPNQSTEPTTPSDVRRNSAMAIKDTFYRDILVKVGLLGVAGVAFLWDFFRGKELHDEPVFVYAFIGFIIMVWIAMMTTLTIGMMRSKRETSDVRREDEW
jgi:hypothetical protein